MSERQRKAPKGPGGTEAPQAAPGDGELDFDGRLARLETIVAELEAGGLGLEASIERYREGIGLLGRCRDVLAGFQRQVEELSGGADGGLAPFPGDPDLGPGGRP